MRTAIQDLTHDNFESKKDNCHGWHIEDHHHTILLTLVNFTYLLPLSQATEVWHIDHRCFGSLIYHNVSTFIYIYIHVTHYYDVTDFQGQAVAKCATRVEVSWVCHMILASIKVRDIEDWTYRTMTKPFVPPCFDSLKSRRP